MTRTADDVLRGRSREGARRGERAQRDRRQTPALRPATLERLPPPTPAVALTHREPTRRRRIAARWPSLGARTWPAYAAAGITAAYGMLKAYWVFGGNALWSIAPLSPEMIEKAKSGTAPRWFEIADAVSVVLAVAGVILALATVRRRRWLPAGLVKLSLWPLAVLMVLRAVLSIVGDAMELATGGSTGMVVWDLVLWSPLFLIWGLLWAATALTYARRWRADSGGVHEEPHA